MLLALQEDLEMKTLDEFYRIQQQEKRIKEQTIKPTLLKEYQDLFEKMDHGKAYYRSYDKNIFENKSKIDLMYLKKLLHNLDESYQESVHDVLKETFKLSKNIYEFINIEPKIYGKGVNQDIINESIEKSDKLIKDVLENSIDSMFYKLDPNLREKKYGDKAKVLAESLIEGGNDSEEAIQFAIKTCVMEDLITKIIFPSPTWQRLSHLVEDENFAKVFDQEKLIEYVENFEKNVNVIAKYCAAAV